MLKPLCHPNRKYRSLGMCGICYTQHWNRLNPNKRKAIARRHADQNQTKMNELKSNPCIDCGGVFPPECMDWDHVRGEKLFGLGRDVKVAWDKQLAEIEKCDLVCANCHRIRTKKRRGDPMLVKQIQEKL